MLLKITPFREDEWLGLGSGFVLDDAFKCTSPIGADTSLQVPLREPTPVAVSPQDLMDFSFADNSLAVPIRDFGFQSGNEPPRLSPVSSSFQSMAPLQNMSYEMTNATVVQEDTYNSFEQPSLVVNGHYQTIEQQIIQPQQGFFQITEIGAEMAQLQEQQDKLGINNSQRLSELQAQRASILYEALCSQNVGETVLSQVKQVAAAAAPASQTRSTARVRSGHSSRPTHFESAPESPQYQPQMYLASHNQYPSTSTAQFQEFSTGPANQGLIVHQQEPVTVRHQPQQRIYRTQNSTTTVYHTASQLPPGTVYVQNVQQGTQAQFASSQPTVGEVVRQQHQLRHVSGAQQVIVQQMAPPQVVVAAGAQTVGGAQIRTQIVQHSPLPAQIVLTPAVPQTHQVVVVAQRSSPAQTAKRLEEKRASRLSRLRNYFDSLHETLSNPDTESPFSDLRDVLQRLLPYHTYGEPNFSEEYLEQFDSNYLRTTINLMEQRKRLEKRLRKVFYDDALHGTEVEERNLLLYLDGEYERRKLEEEREFVKQGNVEAFVHDSPIVAALRESNREPVEKSGQMTSSKSSSRSVMQQYEYHPFEEIPFPLSPYKSPSPFKSPTSSISSSSKFDEPKEDILRPLPPPLPSVAARRVTPSRTVADKDSSSLLSSSPSPSHVSHEKTEILSSISTPGRLPAKKELLSRARQGVPAEMRSPPAHSSCTNSALFVRNSVEDYESDGSASPELGVDDVVVPHTPTPSKLNKSPHRTSLHVVLQEDVKPLLKREEDKPAERFRFKPQVRICDKPPPIRLKLKLDGKEVYIENNENSEKGHEKKQKKHKKKKKEGHKRRSEDFKHVKDQQRPQELRKSDVKKTMNDASPQEVVAVTSNGIRMKLKFGLGANIMNSITRSVSTKESEEPKLVHKVFDSQPSTSRASSLVSVRRLS
uniref:GLTSCR1 domain-containing protein n=1 Tax=Angiostrongylus cantonensis TaxID=6313 RepID=A0A158PCL0_ANGCA